MGPITSRIVMGLAALALGWAAWTQADLSLTKRALEDAENRAHAWEQISTAQENVRRAEARINRAADAAVARIRGTANANQPVSPDVSAAWGDGIDGVRHDARSGATEQPEKLFGPGDRKTPDRGPDARPIVGVLSEPRARLSKLQPTG